MPAHRPFAVVLAARTVSKPAPIAEDLLGRPINGPCLIWTGALDPHGYGRVGNKDFGNSLVRFVHRASYALAKGVHVDEPGILDHLCRVPACAAPGHLEEVTNAENIRRGRWGIANRERKAQAECLNGHLFSAENTYYAQGQRFCRACKRDRDRTKYDYEKERTRKGSVERRGPYGPQPHKRKQLVG